MLSLPCVRYVCTVSLPHLMRVSPGEKIAEGIPLDEEDKVESSGFSSFLSLLF